MSVLDHAADDPMKPEEHATLLHAGGITNYGYQCGMLWGAVLAAGAQVYKLYGAGPQAETAAVMIAQRITDSFRAGEKNEINCLEITDINMQGKVQMTKILKFFIKGQAIHCVRMAVRYSREAFHEIEAALAETYAEAVPPPVSCTAMMAQKMGVSEKQVIMAAGLAGGIGLSGSGCGALGAAIWIDGLNSNKEGASDKVILARASETIDRFLRSTDFKFECSEIVGRRFESIGDHAAYMRDGGCAEIIEVLAVNPNPSP